MTKDDDTKASSLDPVSAHWGEKSDDHYGYASDEERRAKRGLEDWEMIEQIPDSQRRVPPWFLAVIAVVLLVAVGLSFPFWGDRPGYEREWINWGFAAALLYIGVAAAFVYFMVNLYGSRHVGRLDSDKDKQPQHDESVNEQRQDRP